MPTESVAIKYSAARAMRVLTDNQMTSANILFNLQDVLVNQVNWTLIGLVAATGSFKLAFGLPVDVAAYQPTGRATIDCCAFAMFTFMWHAPYFPETSLKFIGYFASDTDPIDNPLCPPCIFVPFGPTVKITAERFAAAISLATGFTATAILEADGFWHIELVADTPGPQYNWPNITTSASAFWALAAFISGGGYRVRSALPASQYEVEIVGGDVPLVQTEDITIGFNFWMKDPVTGAFTVEVTPQYHFYPPGAILGTVSTFKSTQVVILANPHQFFMFDDSDDSDAGYARSIFACAPFFPPELYQPTYMVFIIGPNTYRSRTQWFTAARETIVIDSNPPLEVISNGGWFRLLSIRNPTFPLLSPQGFPLVETAFLEAGPFGTASVGLICQIWDCAVISDYLPSRQTLNGVIASGKKFLSVGGQPGASNETRSSLCMAFE